MAHRGRAAPRRGATAPPARSGGGGKFLLLLILAVAGVGGAWAMGYLPQLDPLLQPINADPGRLRQVLHNLLLNANDALAATADPLLRINTRHGEIEGRRFVELETHDNGPGFAPSVLDHLFEPYVTTKEKGTGLGLAIVKKIVEEHSGSLWATNPAEGGALLVIRLPMDAVFTQTESHGDGLARERSA